MEKYMVKQNSQIYSLCRTLYIYINGEQYIYIGDIQLRYVLYIMLHINMEHYMVKRIPHLYIYIYIIIKNIKNDRKIIFVYERKTLYIGREDQR